MCNQAKEKGGGGRKTGDSSLTRENFYWDFDTNLR